MLAMNTRTLISAISPKVFNQALVRNTLLVVLGTCLLTISAHVQVPFWPVKLSMQTFAVLLIATVLGRKLGVATVLAYIAQGVIGLPVFQSGAGLAYLAGPTGGYLVGFVVSAWLMGMLAERGWLQHWATSLAAVGLSLAVVYVPGLAWMSVLFGLEQGVAYGLLPFLTGDLLKLALAVVTLPTLRHVSMQRGLTHRKR